MKSRWSLSLRAGTYDFTFRCCEAFTQTAAACVVTWDNFICRLCTCHSFGLRIFERVVAQNNPRAKEKSVIGRFTCTLAPWEELKQEIWVQTHSLSTSREKLNTSSSCLSARAGCLNENIRKSERAVNDSGFQTERPGSGIQKEKKVPKEFNIRSDSQNQTAASCLSAVCIKIF